MTIKKQKMKMINLNYKRKLTNKIYQKINVKNNI